MIVIQNSITTKLSNEAEFCHILQKVLIHVHRANTAKKLAMFVLLTKTKFQICASTIQSITEVSNAFCHIRSLSKNVKHGINALL